MQKDSKFFEDIAKIATGAAGEFMEMKRSLDDMVMHRVEGMLQKMQFASREEFDTLKAMIAKLREEQEELKKRLEKLEKNTK